ncbi:MAG: prepilin-type N-terminal cleavage/methylation domain-containing protein [Actinobacteria bacterium]|nr:prepilin-type N-terminal cleavage/methylation domain-containing protein [Actinomycetota bacterium]
MTVSPPMITQKQIPTRRQSSRPSRPASLRTRAEWRAEHGFTIVEVMVASLLLVVGALALVGLVDAANGATSSNKRREAGTNLAREVIENAGTIAYDDVTPDRLVPALQARPGLADSSAATGYTVPHTLPELSDRQSVDRKRRLHGHDL